MIRNNHLYLIVYRYILKMTFSKYDVNEHVRTLLKVFIELECWLVSIKMNFKGIGVKSCSHN